MTQWAVYEIMSPRIALLLGCFVGDLDYAKVVEDEANRQWRAKSKRHRHDRFRITLGNNNPPLFREGRELR